MDPCPDMITEQFFQEQAGNSELSAHAFFETSGGSGPAKIVGHISNAGSARVIEVFVGGFGFDNQRCARGSVVLAVTVLITDMEQQFDVALHIQVTAGQVGKLHGSTRPRGFHCAQRESRTNDKIFDVSGGYVFPDFQESGFPGFTFPAV